jgi:hypothetical protein
MTQPIRMAHKAMADSRAMEEQMERENPLDGRGATPSMGLSQFRGGAMAHGKALSEHLHSLHGSAYAKDFCRGMTQCGGLGTGRYEGQGAVSDIGHKLSDMLPGPYGKFGHSVSKLAGLFGLGKQPMEGGFLGMMALALPLIGKLLGAGKMTKEAHDTMAKLIKKHEKKYHSGKMEGGSWLNLMTVALPLIGNLLGAGQMTKGAHDQLKRMFKKGEKMEKMEGAGRCVGAGTGGRREPVPYGRPQRPVMELMDGGLKISDLGHNLSNVAEAFGPNQVGKVGHSLSNIAGMFGMGQCEPAPMAKKAKRIVGEGDGRRKRAEIVKRVMAEKGMKMIDASRFVKENNLY